MHPRWLASCSDDGIIKVWDVAMPAEPIVSAATGSKSVTDVSFHPQRRGSTPSCLYCQRCLNSLLGLLFASLRAEQRVEIFDVSVAPMAGSEHVAVTPWRSYDLHEEVRLNVAVLFYLLWSISCIRRSSHSHLPPFRLQQHAGNQCPISRLPAFYFP
jgi:hypothetical protein